MGAVRDRSVMGLTEAKAYARAQTGMDCAIEDIVLSIILDAAKERADYICQNPFVQEDDKGEPILDANGNTLPLPIPMEVELWVLRKFVRNYTYRVSGNNKEQAADVGNFDPDKEDWRELITFIKF